ncbi:hypothetical protein [Gluconobacter oxydans]|uniref:hypothetical protein n=1 Tax=Gluconobacter oxydans TaxID=442 RepID=UPI0026489BCF|nr:hypothetical protein [Gluconobacter oxydans]WKE49061.1 hypothetical protein NUJ38_04925 [Gluconobacter oxydans]
MPGMKIHRRRATKEIFKISEINERINVRHLDQKRKENYSFVVTSVEMNDGKERIFGHCARENKAIHIWPEHFEGMYDYKTGEPIPSLWGYFLPKADQQTQSTVRTDSKKSGIRKSSKYVKRYESSGNPYRVEGVPRLINIKYESALGEITDRKILLQSASYKTQEDDVFLEAFCFLRRERRTFYSSRIISAHDPETGEIIPDTWKWFIEQAEAAENAPVVLPKALEKALLAKPASSRPEISKSPPVASVSAQTDDFGAMDMVKGLLGIILIIVGGLIGIAVLLFGVFVILALVAGIIGAIFS